MVSGGWISWNYNQLSQAKAKAETEFGKNVMEGKIPPPPMGLINWISWNYNQLSQAKARAETEFGKIWFHLILWGQYVREGPQQWSSMSSIVSRGSSLGVITPHFSLLLTVHFHLPQ